MRWSLVPAMRGADTTGAGSDGESRRTGMTRCGRMARDRRRRRFAVRLTSFLGDCLFDGRSVEGDGLAAPFLGSDVGERLCERPMVAGGILGAVLPFAELHVSRLHEDVSAMLSCPLAVRLRVLHTHHHRVRDFAGTGRPAIPVDVGDDHVAVTEPELSASES